MFSASEINYVGKTDHVDDMCVNLSLPSVFMWLVGLISNRLALLKIKRIVFKLGYQTNCFISFVADSSHLSFPPASCL